MVLFYMSFWSSDEFKELMVILVFKYCVIVMDLMGLGDLDKFFREYFILDYVKIVILLLDELGIKKCSILGSLIGGYIVGEVVVFYRECLNKLIFCNVYGFDVEEVEKIVERYR